MDKRWTLAIVTLIMVLLIYSFLSMVLKTDKKKKGHGRVYRDYSSYTKKSSSDDSYSYESNTYASSARARKIKKTLFSNTGKVTAGVYTNYLSKVLDKKRSENNSNRNSRLEEMFKSSQKTVRELQTAILLYRKGEYEEAISKLEEALEKLDPMEMKKRAEAYSLLAECYIKLDNDDGYIQNKIRQIRMLRKYENAMREVVPDYNLTEYVTTQEASTNLLKIKSSVARLPDSPMVREMVKKAELDLEVARKVTQ